MYDDLYLRFSDEDEAKTVLAFAIREGQWIHATHDWALDPIGTLVLANATVNPETGEELTPPVFADGFHVNLRILPGASLPDLSAYEVHPASPQRVWA